MFNFLLDLKLNYINKIPSCTFSRTLNNFSYRIDFRQIALILFLYGKLLTEMKCFQVFVLQLRLLNELVVL